MKIKNVKAGVKVRVKDVDQLHWRGEKTLRDVYHGVINTEEVYTIDADGIDRDGDVGIGGDRDDGGFVVHHTNLRMVKDEGSKKLRVGDRVELTELCGNRAIAVGTKGTVLEARDEFPSIQYDTGESWSTHTSRLRKVK